MANSGICKNIALFTHDPAMSQFPTNAKIQQRAFDNRSGKYMENPTEISQKSVQKPPRFSVPFSSSFVINLDLIVHQFLAPKW